MFKALKNLLEGPAESGSASEQRHLQVAVAVLLNEARRADYDEGDAEWAIAEEALCDLFGISTDESTQVLKEGHARQQQLSSLHGPVTTIKRHWGMPERIRLVEHLWRVVFADGQLNPYEDHCVRKVAHLLHLSNTDSMMARNRAKAILT